MRTLRPVVLLAGLLSCGSALAQTQAPLAGLVRIATEGAHPPFNYVENGVVAGFEVDLGLALCARAKLDCTFVLHQWDGIIKALEHREYDAIMDSLAITERRRSRLALTRPYYRIPMSFLVAKDSPLGTINATRLRGLKVGVVEGTAAEPYLSARHPEAIVRLFGVANDAALDLIAGRLDLVLADKQSVAAFLTAPEGSDCCRLLADAPPGDSLLGEGVAIGLRKDDVALREAFDGALKTIKADGTYDRIRAKYIPFDTK